MPNEWIVDTHALIWYVQGDLHRLGAGAKAVLDDLSSRLVVPSIVLAEAAHLVLRDRTNIPSVSALMAAIDSDPRWLVSALDRQIVELACDLPMRIGELHDRLIVACALSRLRAGIPVQLITKDRSIQAPGSVPVVW